MNCSLFEDFKNFDQRVGSCRDFVKHVLECNENDPIVVVYTEECDGLVDYFREFTKVNEFLVPRENNGCGFKPLSSEDGSIHKLKRFLKNKDYSSIINIINTLEPDREVSWRIGVIYAELETGKNIGHAPGLTHEMLDIKQNYGVIKPKTKRYVEEVTAEDVVGYHISSSSGTNLYVERDKDCFWENEYHLEKKEGRGGIANLTPGEVWMEKGVLEKINANGRIVADLTAIGFNQNFKETGLELILDIERGEMTNIETRDKEGLNNEQYKRFLNFLRAGESESPIYFQELGVGLLLDESSGMKLKDIDSNFFTNGDVLMLEKLSVHLGLGITHRNKKSSKIDWQTHGDVVLDPSGVQIFTLTDEGKEKLVYEKGKLLV